MTAAPAARVDTSQYRWLGSVRGRLGYAFDNWLLFGTGGWAFTNIRHTNDFGAGDSFDNNRSGWTVGGGIEYALTPNWTTRLDYRYFDFGSYSRSAPTNASCPTRSATHCKPSRSDCRTSSDRCHRPCESPAACRGAFSLRTDCGINLS